jgi:uncharacterized protein YbbK (DUF523 family)
MSKQKVIISACLLGHLCRYDGKTKKTTEIVDAFKEYEIIPFCPEAPLFGTPRERISVVLVDGAHKIITDKTKRDVTKQLKEEIASFIRKNQDVDAIVLKSKSPSCGFGSTPIVNEKRETIRLGNGIAAEMFVKEYKNITLKDELNCLLK